MTFLLLALLASPAIADSCLVELKDSAFSVDGTVLTDGKRKVELEPGLADELCREVNKIVWEARRAEKKGAKCERYARLKVQSTQEDFQLCRKPKEYSLRAQDWVESRVMPLLEKK